MVAGHIVRQALVISSSCERFLGGKGGDDRTFGRCEYHQIGIRAALRFVLLHDCISRPSVQRQAQEQAGKKGIWGHCRDLHACWSKQAASYIGITPTRPLPAHPGHAKAYCHILSELHYRTDARVFQPVYLLQLQDELDGEQGAVP